MWGANMNLSAKFIAKSAQKCASLSADEQKLVFYFTIEFTEIILNNKKLN